MKRNSKVSMTLETKKLIVSKIRKYKMKKREEPSKSSMVAIPETEDNGGKPLFINSIQFNKLVDKAESFNKGK